MLVGGPTPPLLLSCVRTINLISPNKGFTLLISVGRTLEKITVFVRVVLTTLQTLTWLVVAFA